MCLLPRPCVSGGIPPDLASGCCILSLSVATLTRHNRRRGRGRQTDSLPVRRAAAARVRGCEKKALLAFASPVALRRIQNISVPRRSTALQQKREPDKGAIQREASPIINSRRPRGHVGFVFKHETLVPHSKWSQQIRKIMLEPDRWR